MTDLAAARRFVALHGRLLERRRIADDHERTLAALGAYRNPDGGFGYLEPDLPDPQSQPLPMLYALEVLHEAGGGGQARGGAQAGGDDDLIPPAMAWLQTITQPDGGVPFALPFDADTIPHAPWMAPQPDPPSSLHMTSALAAAAHRLRIDHPWLEAATAFTWERLGSLNLDAGYETKYVIDFLDAVPDRTRADAALEDLAGRIGGADSLAVAGGTEGEVLTALDVAPTPDHAGRRLFDPAAVERQLGALAAGQQPDGGWTFPWLAWNDAVAWAWRGIVTVNALRTLRANGRLDAA